MNRNAPRQGNNSRQCRRTATQSDAFRVWSSAASSFSALMVHAFRKIPTDESKDRKAIAYTRSTCAPGVWNVTMIRSRSFRCLELFPGLDSYRREWNQG